MAANGLVQGRAVSIWYDLPNVRLVLGAGRQRIAPTVLRVLGFRIDT